MNKWAERERKQRQEKSRINAIKKRKFLKEKEVSGIPCHREAKIRNLFLGLHKENKCHHKSPNKLVI